MTTWNEKSNEGVYERFSVTGNAKEMNYGVEELVKQ